MKAVVFDFNGTMFFDTDKQRKSWDVLFEKYIGRPLSNEEFLQHACGPEAAAVIRYFYRADLSDEEATALTEEKEGIYRRLCREDRERFRLAPGPRPRPSTACGRGVPMAIATGAGRSNLDFYREAFHLERWFDMERIVYDDGELPGKPAPDVYLRACERLHMPPRECVVVEDALPASPPPKMPAWAPLSPLPPPIRPGHWKNCPVSRRSSTIIAILCPFLTA